MKGFYVANAIELENSSEEEAVKFSMNIDAGKVDKVLKKADSSRAKKALEMVEKYGRENNARSHEMTP